MRDTFAFLLIASWVVCPAPSLGAQESDWNVFDTVRVNDISMAYRDIGEGEPLLLLHGFTQTSGMWGDPYLGDLRDLAQHFRLIAADFRAHGNSTTGSVPFSYRQAAEDFYSLLDSLGVERVKAIGHSAGGMALLHMATTQPDRIEAMVLVGTPQHQPQRFLELVRHPDSIPQDDISALAASHSRGEGQARELYEIMYSFRAMPEDMPFTGPYLQTIRARTLIVHGDRDQLIPLSMPMEMYESIPASELWVVPGGLHWPFGPASAPLGHFRDMVLEFLKR